MARKVAAEGDDFTPFVLLEVPSRIDQAGGYIFNNRTRNWLTLVLLIPLHTPRVGIRTNPLATFITSASVVSHDESHDLFTRDIRGLINWARKDDVSVHAWSMNRSTGESVHHRPYSMNQRLSPGSVRNMEKSYEARRTLWKAMAFI